MSGTISRIKVFRFIKEENVPAKIENAINLYISSHNNLPQSIQTFETYNGKYLITTVYLYY